MTCPIKGVRAARMMIRCQRGRETSELGARQTARSIRSRTCGVEPSLSFPFLHTIRCVAEVGLSRVRVQRSVPRFCYPMGFHVHPLGVNDNIFICICSKAPRLSVPRCGFNPRRRRPGNCIILPETTTTIDAMLVRRLLGTSTQPGQSVRCILFRARCWPMRLLYRTERFFAAVERNAAFTSGNTAQRHHGPTPGQPHRLFAPVLDC